MERIPLFKPTFRKQRVLSHIEATLESGWTGMGGACQTFEERWLSAYGGSSALFLNSATAGLHLCLEALRRDRKWSRNDEVISTPITFVSTNHAVLHAGLRPVFADVDKYLCLSPESVENRITSRTRAVIFVGVGGNAGQLSRIVELCQSRGLSLIIDAAHMAGTRVDGLDIEACADAVVYSFQAVKNLPTADSGLLVMRDENAMEAARRLSWLGIDKSTYERRTSSGYKWEYRVDDVGYKYNGNALMAAVALAQLDYLEDDNQYRRDVCDFYTSELCNVPLVEVVETAPDCKSSRHLFQIRVKHRDKVVRELSASGIDTGVHYIANTAYPMYASMEGTCPSAERASNELLSLPLGLHVSETSVRRVVSTLTMALEELQ